MAIEIVNEIEFLQTDQEVSGINIKWGKEKIAE